MSGHDFMWRKCCNEKIIKEKTMALFGKKEAPFDKLMSIYNSLSDDEKSKFKSKLQDVEKAEDEREIDKIEEEKADTTEKADEKKEEKDEETKEIGKEVDEAEEMAESDEKTDTIDEAVDKAEDVAEDKDETEPSEPSESEEKSEAHEDVMAGIDARLRSLEEKFAELLTADEDGKKDYGASGYGQTVKTGYDEDARAEDDIKKLGGRAF